MAAQIKINLLPADEFEKTPTGQFLKWALTIGRYIVIGTELVVILAFLSRFKLDRDLANLNEKIERKLVMIESFGDLEEQMRQRQRQLLNIQELDGQILPIDEVLSFINQNIPVGMFLESLELKKEGGLRVKGVALSEVDLATFLVKLEENEFFTNIDLDSISHGGEEGPEIKFSLNAQLAEKEQR